MISFNFNNMRCVMEYVLWCFYVLIPIDIYQPFNLYGFSNNNYDTVSIIQYINLFIFRLLGDISLPLSNTLPHS